MGGVTHMPLAVARASWWLSQPGCPWRASGTECVLEPLSRLGGVATDPPERNALLQMSFRRKSMTSSPENVALGWERRRLSCAQRLAGLQNLLHGLEPLLQVDGLLRALCEPVRS